MNGLFTQLTLFNAAAFLIRIVDASVTFVGFTLGL